MGTCICVRRECPESSLCPQEALLASAEDSLGVSDHSVTNLVAGLCEISANGCISKAKFQIYLNIYELNFGSVDDVETPRGKLLQTFRRREGFDKEKLSDLMVLLGRGDDALKADALFRSRCKGQELPKRDVRELLQSLVHLSFTVLPQFALDLQLANYNEASVATLEKDVGILKRAQGKVLVYWEKKLMSGRETLTQAEFCSAFDHCGLLCSTTALRQFGRSTDKLPTSL